jgi:hypothetical protein
MGMYDESWCSSCGCSQPYSEDEVTCGECVTQDTNQSNITLIEYIKIFLVSLKQDLEDAQNNIPIPDDEHFESDDYYYGMMDATKHILSVASDILHTPIERDK